MQRIRDLMLKSTAVLVFLLLSTGCSLTQPRKLDIRYKPIPSSLTMDMTVTEIYIPDQMTTQDIWMLLVQAWIDNNMLREQLKIIREEYTEEYTNADDGFAENGSLRGGIRPGG